MTALDDYYEPLLRLEVCDNKDCAAFENCPWDWDNTDCAADKHADYEVEDYRDRSH